MNRDFKGIWIPKELWERKDLSTSEKILVLEIDSLSTGDGCYAKNSHFSDLLGVTNGTVENLISKLKVKKLVDSDEKSGRRYLRVLTHEKMGKIEESPRKNGLEGVLAHEKMGSIVSNTEEKNTTTIATALPTQEPKPVMDEKVNWDNAKTDLQRFMGFYMKLQMPEVYRNGDRKQVGGFFKQYGSLFKRFLETAGTLEVAKMALGEAEKYYKKLGYPWGLKALSNNWGEFVNAAMELKRRM